MYESNCRLCREQTRHALKTRSMDSRVAWTLISALIPARSRMTTGVNSCSAPLNVDSQIYVSLCTYLKDTNVSTRKGNHI